MRVVVFATLVGFMLSVSIIAGWQMLTSEEEPNADAGQEISRLMVFPFRGPLLADEHPSVWVDDFPTVAVVTVEGVGHSSWSTASGEFEGRDGVLAGALIYTPMTLRVDEYIKGSGGEKLDAAIRGGEADGVTLDMEIHLGNGDQAVVFLSEPHDRYGGPIVENAYVIDGDMATSNLDQKSLGVSDLLSGLREAAAAEAAN
jgi:hypothetical protein